MNNTDKRGEVDLFDLLIKVINIFRTSFKTIVLCFLIGLALGITYYVTSPRIYENKLIVSSSILTESYAKKLVENTRRFIGEGNYQALAAQLGLSEAEARNIFVIRIEFYGKKIPSVFTTEFFDSCFLKKLCYTD